MVVERLEHGLVAEPDGGIGGQMVRCRRRVCSMVGIVEMVMMMVTWFCLTFVLLKRVVWW